MFSPLELKDKHPACSDISDIIIADLSNGSVSCDCDRVGANKYGNLSIPRFFTVYTFQERFGKILKKEFEFLYFKLTFSKRSIKVSDFQS